MPDKYKFVSVCERDKPIQTNSKQAFMMHVISCPACRAKLPKSIIEELEPRLSELAAERAKSTEVAGEKKAPVGEKEVTKEPEREQKPITPSIAEEQKARLDALVKDLPSFQDLRKSVVSINEQITSIGEMLGRKIEEGTARPGVEETDEEPPPRTPPQGRGQQPGEFGSGQRQGAFGQSGELPAANRPGYQPGQTPSDTPPAKEPPSGEAKEPSPKEKKGTDLPDLDTPEQINAMEKYLADQKSKQKGKEGEGKAKTVTDYIEPVDKGVAVLEKVVNIFRGGSRAEPGASLAGTPIGDILNLMKAVNNLSISNVKGVVETMKALREGEKVARTVEEPRHSPSSSSRGETSPGTGHVS